VTAFRRGSTCLRKPAMGSLRSRPSSLPSFLPALQLCLHATRPCWRLWSCQLGLDRCTETGTSVNEAADRAIFQYACSIATVGGECRGTHAERASELSPSPVDWRGDLLTTAFNAERIPQVGAQAPPALERSSQGMIRGKPLLEAS
jgi:hypothetical protein